MNVFERETNDNTQPSRGPSMCGDAGAGEINFGVMFLGFFLVGYLGQEWKIDNLLLMFIIMAPALWIGYWSSQVIQRRLLQPAMERATHDAIPALTLALFRYIGRISHRLTFIRLMVLIGLIAFGIGVIGVFVGGSNLEENTWKNLMVRILVLGLYAATLVGLYGLCIVFNGQQKHVWKWVVMVLMALGFLMVGLRGHANFSAVWPEVFLFNGILWLGSGLATLYFYARHERQLDVNQGNRKRIETGQG